MTKKTAVRAGVCFTAAGAVLLLAALLLLCRNRSEDAFAGRQAERTVTGIREILAARPDVPEENRPASVPTETPEPELPTVILDGYGYIGYLEIPALSLTLPVMSEWDYDRLKIAPCRQFGSPRTDDLVIAAHNYRSHFGHLQELTVGDSVRFTDTDGLAAGYTVIDIRILPPTELGTVQNSGFDLVLYTCTSGGRHRIAVFCARDNALSPSANRHRAIHRLCGTGLKM